MTSRLDSDEDEIYLKMAKLLDQMDYTNAPQSREEIYTLRHEIHNLNTKYFELSIENDNLRRELNALKQNQCKCN